MCVIVLVSFKAVGKLSGGHQAAVMVLAVDDTDTADGNICVVTGSKDHYIKVCRHGYGPLAACQRTFDVVPCFCLVSESHNIKYITCGHCHAL